jgi:hypothetical protein
LTRVMIHSAVPPNFHVLYKTLFTLDFLKKI